MTLTVRTVNDARQLATVAQADPFQLAEPSWLVRVCQQLPPERPPRIPASEILRRDKEKIAMAIKIVEAKSAPARLFVRGGISSKSDYVDVLTALSDMKKDQALVVDMDPKAWVDATGKPLEKPEIVFANSLRRRFELGGLTITAYMSGKMQVTVRRLTELEIREKASGKGKRKK
jgi:hypothetical protein